MDANHRLATQLAARVAQTVSPTSSLIEGFFMRGGAGILGGAPKCWKSFFASEIATAVATGTPVAGHFTVTRPAPVLVLNAEDPTSVQIERLEALAASRGLTLDQVPVHLVVERGFQLPEGIGRLQATIADLGAGLVVLDPLIRLHRSDENSAMDMSRILSGLRSLAADTSTSIILVHHARKAARCSPGQALRSSSDLHAFGDSILFLRRTGRDSSLELRIEHKADSSPDPLRLHLRVEDGQSGRPRIARFSLVQGTRGEPDALGVRALALLRTSGAPRSTTDLRKELGVREQDLVRVLAALEADGYILRVGRAGCAAVPVPAPRSGNAGTHPPRSTHRSCRQVQTLLAPLPPLPSTQ